MGSGNAGFTNVLRTVGKGPAIVTFIGDFLKGVVSILIAYLILIGFNDEKMNLVRQYAFYISGLACVLGHMYPIFYGFKGGKGVVTTASVMLMTDWRTLVAALVVFAIMFIVVYAGRAYDAYTCVWNGGEWAMRAVSRESIRSNLPYVFHDHQLFTPEERSKIDRIFLTWSDVGSYARLAGEDVPVWNRYSIVNELSEQKDAYIDEIEAAMEAGEGVYDMIPQGLETLESYLEWMNEAGWYVHDMEYQETILQGVQSFTLAGLEMAHGRENCWYRTQKTFMDAQETEKEVPEWRWENTSGDDHPTIRAVLCDPDYWMMKQPFEVEIIVSDGTNSRTAAVIQAGQKEYEPMEVQLDLTGLQGEIKLELVSTAETKRAVVINPEWSAGTEEEKNGQDSGINSVL